ncbi:uncharacterized protein LOC114523852 [Dendronephthya gigantea]|uniref:uncharacterized protein LOC114523852 n=1 Tax=Dendronephthya gigantea TaxID=151771 RepID=UPI00106C0103|nr:uncharacterized protein LOC114523852 [Dendronephthya gigantea]
MAEAPEPCSASTPLTKGRLQRYFNRRNIPWACSERSEGITLELDVNTLRRNQYTLRLFIPEDFPDSTPKLAVVKPAVLKQRDGTSVPSNALQFQTLGRFRTQEHQETFQAIFVPYPPTTSEPGVYIQYIFMKGVEWLSAYEEHLITGEPVAETIRKYGQVKSVEQIWSEPQKRRLVRESSLLDDCFPGPEDAQWSGDRKSIDVTFRTEKVYVFRVHLPDDYPNSCPQLAIVYPEVLFQVNTQPLPLNSQEFRTLGEKDGALTICHFRPSEWKDNLTIASIVNKGKVWVHAYEMYLKGDMSFPDCLSSVQQCSEN